MHRRYGAIVRQLVGAAAWATFWTFVLAFFDQATASRNERELAMVIPVAFVGLLWTSAGVRAIDDKSGEVAALLASVLFVGFAFPCVVRAVDGPFEPGTPALAPIYSRSGLYACGAGLFVALLSLRALVARWRASPGAPSALRRDDLILGLPAMTTALVFAGLVATVWIEIAEATPSFTESGVESRGYLVPRGDDTTANGLVTFSARRIGPTRYVGLQLDLQDGSGERRLEKIPSEELGGLDRPGSRWTVCFDSGSCSPGYLDWSGCFGPTAELFAADVQTGLAPVAAILTGILLVWVIGMALAFESRRREAAQLSTARAGLLHPNGLVEADGEVFAPREPADPLLPGPVLLVGESNEGDAYRSARSVDHVLPDCREAQLASLEEDRLKMRAHVALACVCTLAPVIAVCVTRWWVP